MTSPFTQERERTLGEAALLVVRTSSRRSQESSSLVCALSSSPRGWRRGRISRLNHLWPWSQKQTIGQRKNRTDGGKGDSG